MVKGLREDTPWNSPEKWKLAASVFTPLAVVFLGVQLQCQAGKIARAHEQAGQVVKKRVELWGQFAEPLNDVYCYFLFVGQWKELSEEDIIGRKRQLDRIMYSNRPFFSQEFFEKYESFMDAAFKPFGGWGEDAKLRTHPIRPQDANVPGDRFTNKDNSSKIHDAYYRLLTEAAAEMELEIGETEKPQTPQSREEIVTAGQRVGLP